MDQVLDLLVYAPIGFALEAKGLLPQLADRGRGQVALMRLAGRMAAQQTPEGDVGETVRQGVTVVLDGLSALLGAADATDTTDAATTTTAPPVTATPATAPFSGYDSMTAREIIADLSRRSPEALTAVLRYERATRARSTVMNRAEQLLG